MGTSATLKDKSRKDQQSRIVDAVDAVDEHDEVHRVMMEE